MTAIKCFLNTNNIRDGMEFEGQINVYDSMDQGICADTCKCIINYNQKYQEYQITILWNYGKDKFNKLHIRQGYGTNHNDFLLENKELIIRDGEIMIKISVWEDI